MMTEPKGNMAQVYEATTPAQIVRKQQSFPFKGWYAVIIRSGREQDAVPMVLGWQTSWRIGRITNVGSQQLRRSVRVSRSTPCAVGRHSRHDLLSGQPMKTCFGVRLNAFPTFSTNCEKEDGNVAIFGGKCRHRNSQIDRGVSKSAARRHSCPQLQK